MTFTPPHQQIFIKNSCWFFFLQHCAKNKLNLHIKPIVLADATENVLILNQINTYLNKTGHVLYIASAPDCMYGHCTGSVFYAKAQIIFDTVCRISNSILKSKWWFFQDFSLYKISKLQRDGKAEFFLENSTIDQFLKKLMLLRCWDISIIQTLLPTDCTSSLPDLIPLLGSEVFITRREV